MRKELEELDEEVRKTSLQKEGEENYAKLIRTRDRLEATIKRAYDIKIKENNEATERMALLASGG